MSEHVLDSPALPLVVELEQQGFALSLTGDGELRVVPGSKLSEDQRRLLLQHGPAVATLLRCCDPGVIARRDAFRRQLAEAKAPMVPALLFTSALPYVIGVCFSCGDPNGRPAFGRCWRCSLGMRLALQWPIPVMVLSALDDAKIA